MLRTGVKRDGTLWAWDARVYYNGGAYGARTPQNRMNGTFMAAGSYRTPHVRMTGFIVYTNQVPSGYFRAPGEVQTLFAVESHMDMMANALGFDPLEFRLRNALREGDTKPNGEHIRDVHALDVLLGVQPGTYRAELSPAMPVPVAPGLAETGTPGEMIRRRPDLIVAERRLAAADGSPSSQLGSRP